MITIRIGKADRFEQFACTGQINVTNILRKKKDVEKNLGGSDYDMDGILRCTHQFRNKVDSIEFDCYTYFAA